MPSSPIQLQSPPNISPSRCFYVRQKHEDGLWHVKMVHPGTFFRKQAALLECSHFKVDEDIHAYQNVAALFEVVYGRFAMLLMPGRVPESELCMNQLFPELPRYMSASKIVPGFESIHDMALQKQTLKDKHVYGLFEVIVISKFLGDLDSVAGQNIGMMPTATKNIQAFKIDYDLFGDFSEWNLPGFLAELTLNPLLTIMIEGKPTLVLGLFDGAKFPKHEIRDTLQKIAAFDLSQLNKTWQFYKPLMLDVARNISRFSDRVEAINFIQRDIPLAVLRERQCNIKEMMDGKELSTQYSWQEFLKARRATRLLMEKRGME